MPERSEGLSGGVVTLVGLMSDDVRAWPPDAISALGRASCVFGTSRLLNSWVDQYALMTTTAPLVSGDQEHLELGSEFEASLQAIRHRVTQEHRDVVVLSSGDPGFFGILRSILRVLDRSSVNVLPAPSAVSIAFARLSLPWDDAVVVSAHARPIQDATWAIRTSPKVAVLTSPNSPPEALGAALIDSGARVDLAAVCSRLGHLDETVRELTLEELRDGTFDPLSVVVLVGPGALPIAGWAPGRNALTTQPTESQPRSLAWGRPEIAFDHRGGMITKSEVRAVVLGKLNLPQVGVLWDVGAGSGSVGIEAALLCRALTVISVEESAEDAARITSSATRMGAGVHVVTGHAPDVFDRLPAPDRVFVGGGGIPVLEAALSRLSKGGSIVATFAAIERAAKAAELLGNLVQINLAEGKRLEGTGGTGWRLDAKNPVFVAWGPSEPR